MATQFRSVLASLALAAALATHASAVRASLHDDGTPDIDERWDLHSINVGYRYLIGNQPSADNSNGARAAVPFTRRMIDVGYDGEFYFPVNPSNPHSTAFGSAIGLFVNGHLGYAFADDLPTSGAFVPQHALRTGSATLLFATGTMLQLVRVRGFLLAAHVGFGVEGPARFWADVAGNAFGGLRMAMAFGVFRARAEYSIIPFWLGATRIEHRAVLNLSLLPGRVGFGVVGWFQYGQERRPEGGYTEMLLGGGIELAI